MGARPGWSPAAPWQCHYSCGTTIAALNEVMNQRQRWKETIYPTTVILLTEEEKSTDALPHTSHSTEALCVR